MKIIKIEKEEERFTKTCDYFLNIRIGSQWCLNCDYCEKKEEENISCSYSEKQMNKIGKLDKNGDNIFEKLNELILKYEMLNKEFKELLEI